MIKKGIIIVCLIFVFVVSCKTIAVAVNVNNILQQMEKNYNQQMGKIMDLTIIQEMESGFASIKNTIYQKKARVNNQEVFKVRSESSAMGMESIVIFDGIYMWSVNPITGQVQQEEQEYDPINIWKMINPDKAEYMGEEKLDGKNAYKIKLNDAVWMMGQEDVNEARLQERTEKKMYSIFWISKKDLVVLRIQNFITSTQEENGKMVTMNNVIDAWFQDYRKVGSLLLSHKMVVANQMDVDDPSLTKEEKEQAMAFMNAMEKMEFIIKNAQVNTGLSDELFDGTKLEPREPLFDNMPGMPKSGQGNAGNEGFSQEQMQELMQNAMEGQEGLQEMMENMIPNN